MLWRNGLERSLLVKPALDTIMSTTPFSAFTAVAMRVDILEL
jgi:hypothetical protein